MPQQGASAPKEMDENESNCTPKGDDKLSECETSDGCGMRVRWAAVKGVSEGGEGVVPHPARPSFIRCPCSPMGSSTYICVIIIGIIGIVGIVIVAVAVAINERASRPISAHLWVTWPTET